MFWESRLSTLRVNANSVNAAAEDEDGAEAERESSAVSCQVAGDGKTVAGG